MVADGSMQAGRSVRPGVERGAVQRRLVHGLLAVADDRLRPARLELADEVRLAGELPLGRVELELGAGVGDVEVTHGELTDPVRRAEGGGLDALHGEPVRVVRQVRSAGR